MEEKCQWGVSSGYITTAGISPAFTLSAPLTFIKLGSVGGGEGGWWFTLELMWLKGSYS